MTKKDDEHQIRKDDDEDNHFVATVDNPIYDMDPDEKADPVVHYKSGQEDGDHAWWSRGTS